MGMPSLAAALPISLADLERPRQWVQAGQALADRSP
jgi:hypothetical protein